MTISLHVPNRQATGRPRVKDKETGEVFVVMRDDRAETGKLYFARPETMTQMEAISAEKFPERFELYVEETKVATEPTRRVIRPTSQPLFGAPGENVQETTVPGGTAEAPKRKRGRPKGSKNKKKTTRRSRAKQQATE